MSNLKNDLEQVKRVLSQSIDHRNAFNNKYNTEIRDLINRYDAVTDGYTQRSKSGILFIDDNVFKIKHYGYEADWTEEYPVALLTDPNFILGLEQKAKDKEQKRLVESREKDLVKLAQLKAKYE